MDILLNLVRDILYPANLTNFMQVASGDFWGSLSSEYVESGAAINSYMIDLINNKLLAYGGRLSNHMLGAARALGAIFAICVAAAQAYKVMAKGEEFHVLNIMRPIMFAFVLSIWPAVCNTLIMPGKYVEKFMRTEYVKAANQMTSLQEDRKDLALKVFDSVTQKKAASEQATDGAKESDGWFKEIVNNAIDSATRVITHYFTLSAIWVMYGLEWVIVQIGQMVFAVSVYIVFLVKVLYLTVLWMFGPIYFVCSILDVWRDQWSNWIGKVVTVSMYGAMGYLCMTFACYMICMTLIADIDKLRHINMNPDLGMGEYLKSGFGTTIMTFVGYMTGAFGMATFNELASMTFPSSSMMGAGTFMSGMKNYAVKTTHTNKIF